MEKVYFDYLLYSTVGTVQYPRRRKSRRDGGDGGVVSESRRKQGGSISIIERLEAVSQIC